MSIQLSHLTLCAALLFSTPLLGKINVLQQAPDVHEYYYFLALKGAHEHLAGHYQRAHETYTQLLRITPDDHALISAALRLEFDHNHFAEVVSYRDKIDPKNAQDKELAFFVAQAYLFLNKNDEGLALLELLRTSYPHDDRFDYFAAIGYTKTGERNKSLSIISDVLASTNKSGRHYLFYFLKAKDSSAAGATNQALDDIAASLENNPSFAKGYFLQGVLFEKQQQYVQACGAYKRYLALSPPDKEVAAKVAILEKYM